MKITARFQGVLADWMGTPSADIELPSPAALKDLMNQIAQHYQTRTPTQLWDSNNKTFDKHVRAFFRGTPLGGLEAPLNDGDEITFIIMAAGG